MSTTRPIERGFRSTGSRDRRGVSPELYPLLPAGSLASESSLKPLDVSHAFRDAVALIWVCFMICAIAAVFGASLFLLFFVSF